MSEALPTGTTCVWLLSCVYSYVCRKVSSVSKALPTGTTRVASLLYVFSCVF